MENIIETERLILRKFIVNDAAFILELLNSEGWLRYIGDRNVKTQEDAENYITNKFLPGYAINGFGMYLVQLKSDLTPIGTCGLIKRDSLEDIDIGFAFLPDYMRKGYAFEAAQATMQYAVHTLKIDRLLAITTPDNVASIKLVEKIGLHFVEKILFEGKEELFLFANK